MHEITASALTLAHETFRCGVPHFRERRLIPIRTSAHLIVFDAEKISLLYTMLEVLPTDETNVERKDNFSSGDVSLPEELSTTEEHYANWNKANPKFPVDKGHSAGSQYRRSDVVEQSDVDTLAGITPEASKTNRNCKGPLESAIPVRLAGFGRDAGQCEQELQRTAGIRDSRIRQKTNTHLPGARSGLVRSRADPWETRKRSVDSGCTLHLRDVSAQKDGEVLDVSDGKLKNDQGSQPPGDYTR